MTEAVKNIKFRTTIDNKVALDSFDQLGQSVQKLNPELSKVAVTAQGKFAPAMNVSRRDLGLFANQVLYTTNITGRLQGQLSNVATGLATGGAYGAAFAGAAALIEILTSKTTEWNKALNETITTLIKIENKGGAFNVPEQNIGAAIQALKNRMEILKLSTGRAVFGGSIVEFETEEMANLKTSITVLEEANEKYQRKLSIIKLLTDAGLTYTETLDKENKETKKLIELNEKLESVQNTLSSGLRGVPIGGRGGGRRGRPEASSLIGDKAQGAGIDVADTIKRFEEIAQGWRGVLTSEFSQFWDETFGYANSLLEMLLKSTFESILAQIATSFLSFLPGGGLFGFIGSLFGGGGAGAAGGGNAPIILKIGNEDVGRFVKRGNEYNRMRNIG